MAGRKLIEKPPDIIERVVEESLKVVGITDIEESKIKLIARLIVSGLAYHYFNNPDDVIKMGFLQFEKSPVKSELFKVTLIANKDVGVVNADTL